MDRGSGPRWCDLGMLVRLGRAGGGRWTAEHRGCAGAVLAVVLTVVLAWY